jgi:aminopeptidase-like protein
MYAWAEDIFPICRSLTGPGVRATLAYIQKQLPGLEIIGIPSGYQAFDWTVPNEWIVRDAYVINENGDRIIDFKVNNLHLVGYSEPTDQWLNLEELNNHLYSLPDQPDAIPYVTSYYKRSWGFCLTHNNRMSLTPGQYRAVIDADLKPGIMNYAELIVPGETDEEILLSTYICHPSMANNEISGPIVTTALAQWIQSLKNRRYTYRIVFLPETIGSIVYLSQNLQKMKAKTIAGFVITCVGDNRAYSLLPSRTGITLADRVAEHVLNNHTENYIRYSFLERGSDERQYCSPLIDLPVVSIMRTKYGKYTEYHTSKDDLSLINPDGLEGGYECIRKCLEALEANWFYKATIPCEPQLGKRGLYNISSNDDIDLQGNVLAYADGKTDLIAMANIIGATVIECFFVAEKLVFHGLLSRRNGAFGD